MLEIIRRMNNLIQQCKNEKPRRLIAQLTTLKDSDPDMLEYLTSLLEKVEIRIGGCSKAKALDLINNNLLEGWCWQSSETCALMFKDTDYIERGVLYFDENKTREYFHSWICFEFDGKEYILDPALNFLCLKEKYFRTFNVELTGVVSVKDLKKEFKTRIKNEKQKLISMGNYKGIKNHLVLIEGVEDIFAPFFRSDVGFITKIENNEIQSLEARYYYR